MRPPTISLRYALAMVMLIVTIGSAGVHFLEGWPWVDSFYWAVTTIATIGSSNLHPMNESTKIFIIAYILICVTLALYTLNSLSTHMIESQRKGMHDMKRMMKVLPTRINKQMIKNLGKRFSKLTYSLR